MLSIISTIAQHPLGSKVHFRNLTWAAQGIDCLFFIQTFKDYNLEYKDFIFRQEKSHLNDTNNYFGFYDEIEIYLKKLIQLGTKVFCFTQQDILFHKNIKSIYEKCLSTESIICSFQTPYQYSIYKESFAKQKISHLNFEDWEFLEYPRIWEGCCFIPSSFIEKFLDQDIRFGHHPKRFRKNGDLYLKYFDVLKNKKISIRGNNVERISDYICSWENNRGNLKKFGHDTLLEVTLFSYLNNYKISVDSQQSNNWVDFHTSNHVAHFHFIEKVCRETKNLVYTNPKLIYDRHDCRNSVADVAFMLLLSGASFDFNLFWDCPKKSIKETVEKLYLFKNNYKSWMSEEQQIVFEKLTFEKFL